MRGCRSSSQCHCHASHTASPPGTFAPMAVVVSRSFLLVCSQSREAVTALRVFWSGNHSSCCHYFFAPGEGAVALGPLPGRVHYPVGVEQVWRHFWLLEVILWEAGIRCQVILVPHPDLEGGFQMWTLAACAGMEMLKCSWAR